jgi:hypothetical protein
MLPWREITMVEEVLLRRHWVGTSQQGSCVRCKVGYMLSIWHLILSRARSVGILWTRNLVQRLFKCPVVGFRDLISLRSISMYGIYAVAGVVGLVVSTSWLLLLILARVRGRWSISADVEMV